MLRFNTHGSSVVSPFSFHRARLPCFLAPFVSTRFKHFAYRSTSIRLRSRFLVLSPTLSVSLLHRLAFSLALYRSFVRSFSRSLALSLSISDARTFTRRLSLYMIQKIESRDSGASARAEEPSVSGRVRANSTRIDDRVGLCTPPRGNNINNNDNNTRNRRGAPDRPYGLNTIT